MYFLFIGFFRVIVDKIHNAVWWNGIAYCESDPNGLHDFVDVMIFVLDDRLGTITLELRDHAVWPHAHLKLQAVIRLKTFFVHDNILHFAARLFTRELSVASQKKNPILWKHRRVHFVFYASERQNALQQELLDLFTRSASRFSLDDPHLLIVSRILNPLLKVLVHELGQVGLI